MYQLVKYLDDRIVSRSWQFDCLSKAVDMARCAGIGWEVVLTASLIDVF